jgi:hypothetical protein
MPTLTRIPLVSLVCPSAPFLAPRLVRATVPVAVAALQSQQRTLSSTAPCYANAAKGKKSGRSYFLEMRKREQQKARRRERGEKDPEDVSPEVVQLAMQLQQACEARDVPQLMDLYPAALDAGIIDRKATRTICQALHASVRRSATRRDNSKLSILLPFVEQVVNDIRKGVLPPHDYAYVHLLGIYKDCKRFHEGRALWLWLVQQNDTHVSQAAYGAAIELMAYGGLMTLPELEQLYEEGLNRFPGTYAEYHLSPDAIVPDRTQPVHIVGLPTTLLQGIVTARLLSRDWRKAYLGLDTVLRLYPSQTPHRFFELFITERPVSEAYTAFLLACRSGVYVSGGQVTSLLTRLRTAMRQSRSLADRFMILRAIANALYAYQECGGKLSSLHVGAFIQAFECLLPEQPAHHVFTKEEAHLRDAIVLTAQETLSGLIQSGLSPDVHMFAALISLAGKMRVPELIKSTLQDAQALGLKFEPAERRGVLLAAGLVKDRELIQQVWLLIVANAEEEGTQISYTDWITFAKACRRADYAGYVREELQKRPHAVTAYVEQRVLEATEAAIPNSNDVPLESMTSDQVAEEFKALQAQLTDIKTVVMSGQPLDLQKSPFYMHLDSQQPTLGSEEDLRAMYDEFTTDPHQPAAPTSANDQTSKTPAAALSKTNIPLDELRFRNWINVLEMMSAASVHEKNLQSNIDQAIKQRKSPKDIPTPLHLRTDTKPAPTLVDLRNRIKELRTSDQTFRKVGSQVQDERSKPMAHKKDADTWQPLISKHITKPFTVRKHETETPDEVFEPMTFNPSASRWHTRTIKKTYSDAAYDAKEVKSKFEASSKTSTTDDPAS